MRREWAAFDDVYDWNEKRVGCFDALQGVAGYVTQVRGETFRLE